jgi:hypothetical protein
VFTNPYFSETLDEEWFVDTDARDNYEENASKIRACRLNGGAVTMKLFVFKCLVRNRSTGSIGTYFVSEAHVMHFMLDQPSEPYMIDLGGRFILVAISANEGHQLGMLMFAADSTKIRREVYVINAKNLLLLKNESFFYSDVED